MTDLHSHRDACTNLACVAHTIPDVWIHVKLLDQHSDCVQFPRDGSMVEGSHSKLHDINIHILSISDYKGQLLAEQDFYTWKWIYTLYHKYTNIFPAVRCVSDKPIGQTDCQQTCSRIKATTDGRTFQPCRPLIGIACKGCPLCCSYWVFIISWAVKVWDQSLHNFHPPWIGSIVQGNTAMLGEKTQAVPKAFTRHVQTTHSKYN